MTVPTPQAVELWSYLIGLGPVGEPVNASNQQVCEDLNIRLRNRVPQIISQLIGHGIIRRDGIGTYTVLRRIEDEGRPTERAPKKPRFELGVKHFEQWEWGAKRIERLARLEEIPPDTRDLTARICGDPIPLDPRRPWQGDANAHA